MMKPILFNTAMVRSILAGRKSVTRRVVKPQPEPRKVPGETGCYIYRGIPCGMDGILNFAPYRPGDILYVRETWTTLVGSYLYKANQKPNMKNPGKWRPSIHMPKEAARLFLRVTDVRVERLQEITDDGCIAEGIHAWTKDGKLYKYYPADKEGDYPDCKWSECPRNPKEAMNKIWDSTIKKADLPRYGWAANPLVWVIEFEQISKDEAPADG